MPATARTPQPPAVETVPMAPRKAAKPKLDTGAGSKLVKVTLRRQGGARVMTIPPALLTQLGVDTGSEFALGVRGGKLVAEPVAAPAPGPVRVPRPRYTLDDLLVGAEHLPEVYASVAGTLDGEPVGREVI